MHARYTKLMILLYARTHGIAQNVAVVMLQKLLGITDSLFHYVSTCVCICKAVYSQTCRIARPIKSSATARTSSTPR